MKHAIRADRHAILGSGNGHLSLARQSGLM
jgi:hypothetical protein